MFRKNRSEQVRWSDPDEAAQTTHPLKSRGRLATLGRLTIVAALLGTCVTVGLLAYDQDRLSVRAQTAEGVAPAVEQAAELAALRAEVDLLTEQSAALRAELALLTGQRGVLPQMIARLQKQRQVNAAHSDALHQLFLTTGALGAAIPAGEQAAADTIGGRPVQVTPVARAQAVAPQRVVLIPQDTATAEGTTNERNGDGE